MSELQESEYTDRLHAALCDVVDLLHRGRTPRGLSCAAARDGDDLQPDGVCPGCAYEWQAASTVAMRGLGMDVPHPKARPHRCHEALDWEKGIPEEGNDDD